MSAIMYDQSSLKERVSKALRDDFKHEAIKTAQEVIGTKRDALAAEQGETWDELRQKAAEIRDHVLSNLDYYIKEFATNAQKAGAHVYFAPTGDDALEKALDIFEAVGAKNCVKSKSMMSEEIGLNAFLDEHGIKAVETDCAEHILQTAGDPPSHIVVPALHFDRNHIRDLYHEKMGYEGTEVPHEITNFLRQTLRPLFLSADVGVTGCNFGVANTGSCTLVTNEGNGRMVTCGPRTQIVIMGMERIVPDLASLDTMLALLPRSAVGSKITSSFTINTANALPGEVDGPRDVHIIMINNGRSDVLASEYREMLRCIRCGACMNTCPVYRHITGHGYGSIYPGPMGLVLTPLLTGYDQIGKMENACTLCGACADVCPVKIPLNELILEHRTTMVEEGYTSPTERKVFGMAARMLSDRGTYETMTKLGSFGMRLMGGSKHRLGAKTASIPVLKGWTSQRDMDGMAPKKFREVFAEHKQQINAEKQKGERK